MSTTNTQLATEDKIDRRILYYVAWTPGCTKDAVWRAIGAARSRVESLVERGLIRRGPIRRGPIQVLPEEGRPRGLYLTEDGWRKLEPVEGLALDMRLLLYIAENPGCMRGETEAAGDDPAGLTETDWEYRRWRVNSFIQRGLVRAKGEPNRARLHLTDEGRAYLFGGA